MNISLARAEQATELYHILANCRRWLDSNGIFQWTDAYPTPEVVIQDIAAQKLYCYAINGIVIGMVTINEQQEPEYASVNWAHCGGRVLVIHRLAVEPAYQGSGIARMLMDFAEETGRLSGYSSVTLDAYTDNRRVLAFYERRGYEMRGEVFFTGRSSPFNCYEKKL